MSSSRYSQGLALLVCLLSSCSHRNRADQIPTHFRHFTNAQVSENRILALTNDGELLQTDAEASLLESLPYPKELLGQGPSPLLYTAGNDLYLLGQTLVFSADRGSSWQELPLPKAEISPSCFDVDAKGQRLAGYGDQLWYAENANEPWKLMFSSQGLSECLLLDSMMILSHQGVTEVRSLHAPEELKAQIEGQWPMTRASDNSALYLASFREKKLYRLRAQEGLDVLAIPYPSEAVRNLAAFGDRLALATASSVSVYKDGQLLSETKVSQNRGFLRMTANDLWLVQEQSLERLGAERTDRKREVILR